MKGLKWMLAAAVSATMFSQTGGTLHAAGTAIVDFDRGSYLLNDGTAWKQDVDNGGYTQLDFDLTEIEGGYGITTSGTLVQLQGKGEPQVLKNKTGVVHISGDYYLDKSGGLRSLGGNGNPVYTDIAKFADSGNGLVVLTKSGILKAGGFSEKIEQFSTSSEVTTLDGYSDSYSSVDDVAVVLQSGKVLLYNRFNFDRDNLTKYIPVTITENAADAKFDDEGNLVVLMKDGTVGRTGSSVADRYKLTESFQNLKGITKLISVYSQGMYVKTQDGSVASYDVQLDELEKLTLPGVTDLSLKMDKTNLTVGDKVPVQITEFWTGGSTRKVPLKDADLTIEKPALLQKLSDGTLKALAVGVTKVTVKSGSLSKTLEVSISSDDIITTGALIGGSMYLPVQAVFQQLGASVQYNGGTQIFSIKLNSTPVQLQLGSDTAVVNGKKIKMSGKVQTVDGVTVFPAALLKSAFGAGLAWNSSIQSMTITFGKAEMQVQTKQTALIYKKKAQGNLANLIGKSYWINFFDTDYRFQKVTVVDVLPDYNGNFALAFKFPSGQILNTYETSGEAWIRILADKEEFFTADPYKTYKWSSAVWADIKEGYVSIGMTKQQVELSWGIPDSKSAAVGSGIRVETWQYDDFNYVTFTNGVVSFIYTS
ncbi:copper amine oxidase N-terminal domain-containing protein [Paenibacillus sp. FSL R7-0345]|uniref:copper amine oxidase N-terminal domain-containing protein n=1 Tax=Paenibacillus sp. FSL R7-0345 TaxID=2954535 RepID=UPI00315B11DE